MKNILKENGTCNRIGDLMDKLLSIRYQDCVFIGSDIVNHHLRIKMESNQKNVIII